MLTRFVLHGALLAGLSGLTGCGGSPPAYDGPPAPLPTAPAVAAPPAPAPACAVAPAATPRPRPPPARGPAPPPPPRAPDRPARRCLPAARLDHRGPARRSQGGSRGADRAGPVPELRVPADRRVGGDRL